ncbi:hypothetical protein LCGC14_1104500 [marine sediment metagenome]|uniref:Uncharacterized protein n=1 Tax=marine sediment metagenome TaxID=412755 RepID=A0A0F9QEU0_9ZZZZ
MSRATAIETRRAEDYKVLAECYYPPDERLMAMLAGLAESATGPIAEIVRCAGDVPDIQPLQVDHAKLFVGPYQLLAPPYGSTYLEDGKLMGESTVDVRGLYAEEELDVIVKDAPDHVAVELEFMYLLASRRIEALEASDDDLADRYGRKQQSFLTVHLARWVPEFTARVEKAAQSEFYRTLGSVTRRIVEEALSALG